MTTLKDVILYGHSERWGWGIQVFASGGLACLLARCPLCFWILFSSPCWAS